MISSQFLKGRMLNQFLVISSAISLLMSLCLGLGFWWTLGRLLKRPQRLETPESIPSISVIIPARDEEEDLRTAVESVLAQDSVNLQVIIVNDHSSDQTGAIADSLADDDSRVTVVHDPPLVDGWLGKVNAMNHGLARAKHELILFTDADVVHAPQSFGWAVSQFHAENLDLLSLAPKFEFESFWENVLLPHALIAGTVQFLLQNVNGQQSKEGAAAGAFILTHQKALKNIGGLASIKSEFLDDVELARRVKAKGLAAIVWFTPDLLEVRLFKSNSGAFWGLTKNILGAVDQTWMAFPAMFLPIFVYWVPLAAIVVGFTSSQWTMFSVGLAAYLIQASLLWLGRPMMRIRLWKALFFPLATFPVIACFSKAIYHRCASNSVAWRGRVIATDGN